MENEIFEKLVQEGIDLIPKEFLVKLENLAIVVEGEPTPEQMQKLKLGSGYLLFGLYEGVPQTKRGPHYGMTLPDKITIFQKQIEQYAHSGGEIRQIVCDTVWHEIAHHFGTSERRIKDIEAERKKKRGKVLN
jgi:predicted Zn-dependent protease with MMP-like domain